MDTFQAIGEAAHAQLLPDFKLEAAVRVVIWVGDGETAGTCGDFSEVPVLHLLRSDC